MLFLKHSIKKHQSGAALIEFAIIVPLLLLLVVGISEFGFAFYHLNILNKSVQDGARYFADPQRARQNNLKLPIDTSGSTNATNINATRNLIIYGNTCTGDTICCPLTTPCPPPGIPPLMPNAANYSTPIVPIIVGDNLDHIEVTATYNHNLITGDLLSGLINIISGGNVSVGPVIPLTASTVLRVEGG